MAKTAVKWKTERVPANQKELEQYVMDIRKKERRIRTVERSAAARIAKLEARIEAIKEDLQIQTRPLEEEIDELAKGVYVFAQGNKEKLIEEARRKTVIFSTGDGLRWRFSHTAVIVKDKNAAIDELKEKNLSDCIRVTEEINKTEVLKHADEVESLEYLSIERNEIFSIVMKAIGMELKWEKRKFKKVPL